MEIGSVAKRNTRGFGRKSEQKRKRASNRAQPRKRDLPAGSRLRAYDFGVTSQRDSFASRSRVRLTRNCMAASRRNELPFARSNSNQTGRRPGELERISRTSRSSSPVVAGENCKSTADSWSAFIDLSFAPLVFSGASVLI